MNYTNRRQKNSRYVHGQYVTNALSRSQRERGLQRMLVSVLGASGLQHMTHQRRSLLTIQKFRHRTTLKRYTIINSISREDFNLSSFNVTKLYRIYNKRIFLQLHCNRIKRWKLCINYMILKKSLILF